MLELRGLRRRLSPEVTVEAEFAVAPGERLHLTGPSGAGKSTLLRLIAGLERPDQGQVLLGGVDLTWAPPETRGVGFVFQEQALFSHLSAGENVAFGLKMRGVGRTERAVAAREWLARVGLGGFERRGVGTLSGGERQRVAIARALVFGPELVLLDEPWTGLDAGTAQGVRELLKGLHAERPRPWVVVSHEADGGFATRTADVRFLEEGRLRAWRS